MLTSPPATLKTVCRRIEGAGSGGWLANGGGGGTEKSARSWTSVSRIRLVMSGLASSAFENMRGGGKLRSVSLVSKGRVCCRLCTRAYGRLSMPLQLAEICSRWPARCDMLYSKPRPA